MPKKKILVIDDDKSFTQTLLVCLEDTGEYEVKEENFGAHAYASAQQFQPDLILLDEMMPDMDGSEVASQIKRDESLAHIPIVFLTAIVRKDEVEETGSDIGGSTFLAKPVRIDDLITCIERKLKE